MLPRILSRFALATSYQILKLPKECLIAYARKESLRPYSKLCYLKIANFQVPFYAYSKQVKVEEITVDFEYVKKATNDQSKYIIDVREPDEVKEHGKIPNSINIPLGSVASVLNAMPEKEFTKQYSRQKPLEDAEIIFYCMIGKRSGMAQQNAMNLGYTNVKNYLGSFTDWASKTR